MKVTTARRFLDLEMVSILKLLPVLMSLLRSKSMALAFRVVRCGACYRATPIYPYPWQQFSGWRRHTTIVHHIISEQGECRIEAMYLL